VRDNSVWNLRYRANDGVRRQDVISCLRINDRKPLDCWKEVEIFKREVRKLEENYVSSVL
jgi:hypothetical protein